MPNSRYLTILFAGYFSLLTGSLSAQVPMGGTQMNATTGTTYQKVGNVTITEVSVSDQPFTKALRIVTGSGILNFWDAQVQFPGVSGIAADDVVLVAFYARTLSTPMEDGLGAATAVIENKTTYAKDLAAKLMIGSEWKEYYASAKCVSTLAATGVRYALFVGYESQTIEVADVRFLNYGTSLTLNDLPVTPISYVGQDSAAAWRAPAQERINQIRKGKADIVVYDENGNLLPDATVSVSMVKHQFGFGSAIPASVFLTNTTFRNKVYELFNEVVFENDLKWPNFSLSTTLNLRKSFDSLELHDIAVRGHNVIWPSWKFCPTSLQSLSSNPVALRNTIEKHIDEVTNFTKGRVVDWDVINEPYSEKDIMGILGNEVMADWFKQVKKNDQQAKLYLNDYGILTGGGTDVKKQNSYYNLVKYIDGLGGQVDGIGFQGHFGSELTSISKVYSILDRFAELGKEIKITEHDINISQRQVQADYTRDLMTIAFSHPAVKSFLFWGFWQGAHWLPDGALYDLDWNIRPHGEAYKDLVFNQWWTKDTICTTDSAGTASFEGFLGTYYYTVKSGLSERSGTFQLSNSHQSGLANTIILSLDSILPPQIVITSSKPPSICEGDSLSLSVPDIEGADYTWFLNKAILPDTSSSIQVCQEGLYSVELKKGDIELQAPAVNVQVISFPEAVITAGEDLSFCPGGKVVLSADTSKAWTYAWFLNTSKIQGSVPTIDVSSGGSYVLTTNASGCLSTSAPVSVQVYASTDPECGTGIQLQEGVFHVFPNPFSGSFLIEPANPPTTSVRVELFDLTGKQIFSDCMNPGEGAKKISIDQKGVYILKLHSAEGTEVYRLLGQ
ncbi:MAG: endo-1,4-beta-xylanase [Bacteroidales bacterium]